MKLTFKLLLLSALAIITIHAREIVVLTYKTQTSSVEYLKEQLVKDVSQKLVSIIESNQPCADIYKEAILHVCFNEEDQMNIVRQNVDVLKKTISKM